MKPGSQFVMAMLALCGVASVEQITREDIRGEHMRLMHTSMTNEASELIGDLAGEADEKASPQTIDGQDQRFIDAGLARLSPDDYTLVQRIFRAQGRNLTISSDGLNVEPTRTAVFNYTRLQRQAAEKEKQKQQGEAVMA
jgi:hypothetical protein